MSDVHVIEEDSNGVPVNQLVDGFAPTGITLDPPADDSDLAKMQADIALLTQILPLEEELEAARAVKDEQPERFFNAKQKYESVRTYLRQCAAYLKAVGQMEDEEGVITTHPAEVSVEAHQVGE